MWLRRRWGGVRAKSKMRRLRCVPRSRARLEFALAAHFHCIFIHFEEISRLGYKFLRARMAQLSS